MKKLLNILSVLSFSVIILAPQASLIAEDLVSEGDVNLSESGVKSGSLANCFDVYKFQSIAVTVGVDQSSYKPNGTVEISGEIINNNPYPILDATIRAKVLRAHPNPVEMRAKYITVSEQIVASNINLKSNDKYGFEYNYFIPSNAPSGEYIVQYYVYNQDRFNLAGLSFTEDVIGNKTSFIVEGKSQHIYLDKTNITVDGQNHDTLGFIVNTKGEQDISVKIPLVNPTSESQEMELNYKLYRWDELLATNLVQEKNQEVLVPANGKVELTYNVEAGMEPVYYIVLTAKQLGEQQNDAIKTQTMAHIRFAVSDNNSPRINWVGLDKYPFQKGETVQLMTCIHNTSNITYQGPIRFKSVVKDSKGRELTKIEYEGPIVPAISGLANTFQASNNLDTINIETSLYDTDNNLLDNVITSYDCNDLNPELCSQDDSVSKSIYEDNQTLIIIGLLILGLMLIVFQINKYNKLKQ
jgi:hypothetical protein